MCEQKNNRAQDRFEGAAGKSRLSKPPAKTKIGRQKYPGFHSCFWHDPLAEILKTPADTLCRKCFTHIGRHQVQLIAKLMIQVELTNRHLHNLDDQITEANKTLKQLLELEK
jgi:hypothetical protein